MTTLSHLIDTLRRLHQEASAGPWVKDLGNTTGHIKSDGFKGESGYLRPTPTVCRYDTKAPSIGLAQAQKNADLIALLRNLAPNLADMLETAERALRHIAFEPLGFSDATHAEALETATERATAALAELERLAGPPLSK